MGTNGGLPPSKVALNGFQVPWTNAILAYIEQNNVQSGYNFTKAWNDPANCAASQTTIPVYRCPSSAGPSTDSLLRSLQHARHLNRVLRLAAAGRMAVGSQLVGNRLQARPADAQLCHHRPQIGSRYSDRILARLIQQG